MVRERHAQTASPARTAPWVWLGLILVALGLGVLTNLQFIPGATDSLSGGPTTPLWSIIPLATAGLGVFILTSLAAVVAWRRVPGAFASLLLVSAVCAIGCAGLWVAAIVIASGNSGLDLRGSWLAFGSTYIALIFVGGLLLGAFAAATVVIAGARAWRGRRVRNLGRPG